MTEILQQEETLDSCLSAVETFRNGCNFRALIKSNGDAFLSYGCYGVLVNIARGKERLLMEWLEKNKGADGYALLKIKPETKMELMRQRPCSVCGGLMMEAK